MFLRPMLRNCMFADVVCFRPQYRTRDGSKSIAPCKYRADNKHIDGHPADCSGAKPTAENCLSYPQVREVSYVSHTRTVLERLSWAALFFSITPHPHKDYHRQRLCYSKTIPFAVRSTSSRVRARDKNAFILSTPQAPMAWITQTCANCISRRANSAAPSASSTAADAVSVARFILLRKRCVCVKLNRKRKRVPWW